MFLFFPSAVCNAMHVGDRVSSRRRRCERVGAARIRAAVSEALEPRMLLSANYLLSTVADFNGNNGQYPAAGLIMDSSGNLYGTTSVGGANGYGTVLEIAKGSNTVNVLTAFNGTNGEDLDGGLIMDSSGNLFGTTSGGGEEFDPGAEHEGYGTVFEITAGTHSMATLAEFDGYDGENPRGDLFMDSNGNLYGTASSGGDTNSDGTVFEIANGSSSITAIADFNGINGANPYAALIMDSNGNLYGTTQYGGSGYTGAVTGNGTVFELANGSHTIDSLAQFNGTNGSWPLGTLVRASSGNLYGTTEFGGPGYTGVATGEGTVFEVTNGSSSIITLVTFNGANGQEPFAGLVMDNSGNLYGATYFGGSARDGAVFEVAKTILTVSKFGTIYTYALSDLAVFNGTNGAYPDGGLLMTNAGDLYGTTSDGGNTGRGTVFEMALNPKLAFAQQTTNAVAGNNLSPLVVAVEDSSNNLIRYDTSTITLSISSGPSGATLGGTVAVQAVNSVATFNALSITTAGTYTLKATDVTDGLVGPASASFVISPAAPSRFATKPTRVAAGSPLSPLAVSIVDTYGNVETKDDSTITLTKGKGPGTLGGTTTVHAVNGVAMFKNLSITTMGTYTLLGVDVADALIRAAAETFIVTPAAASKLVFTTQPANASPAAMLSVTVRVEDRFGNLVTSNLSTVTLSIDSGPSWTSLGVSIDVKAINGVATFDFSLSKSGTYRLAATDGTLTSATSSTFKIS